MRTQAFALVACLCGCLAAAGARAELYQWTDEHGQVHVTDDASQVPRGTSITVEPTRTRASAATSSAATRQPPAASHSNALSLETVSPQKAQAAATHVLHFQRAGQEISLDVTIG